MLHALLLLVAVTLVRVEPEVLMADTGWLLPTTAEDVASGAEAAWSNLANLTAEDDAYATVSLVPTQVARLVRTYGFDVAGNMPEGTSVEGIEVRVSAKVSSGSVGIADVYLIDPDTGSQVGDDKGTGTVTTTEQFFTFGGAADDWAWADVDRAQLIAAGFKVAVKFASPAGSLTISADSVQLKVHYGAGDGPLASSTAVASLASVAPSADIAAVATAAEPSLPVAPSSGDIAAAAATESLALGQGVIIGQAEGDGLLVAAAAGVELATAMIQADAALVSQVFSPALAALENTVRRPLRSQLITPRLNRTRSIDSTTASSGC